MTSTPSLKVTPSTTFGNWFSPFSRRQVLAAAITSLNTISLAVSCDKAPFVRTVRWRTVANTLSIGPCCTDQRGGHIDPNPRRGSCDADRLRASELEHAVQSTNGDRDFCGLTIVCARTERIADHPFVARDRRLRLGPGVVAGSLLPAYTATFGDQLQMP